MKKLILFCSVVVLTFANCSKDEELQDSAQIIGQDMALCACCGGWFIEINNTSYRFNELPADSDIDLDTETYPINVELNWRVKNQQCLGDEIVVDKIRKN